MCQCFHPYLMKYLVMICRGHVPILGMGPKSSFGNVNSDVKKFLYYFLPKGQALTRQSLNCTWRSRNWRRRKSTTS
jgi:hypothetical protein